MNTDSQRNEESSETAPATSDCPLSTRRISFATRLCCVASVLGILCDSSSSAITPDCVAKLVRKDGKESQAGIRRVETITVPIMGVCTVLPEVAIYSYPVFHDWKPGDTVPIEELTDQEIHEMQRDNSSFERIIKQKTQFDLDDHRRALEIRVVIWANGCAIWSSQRLDDDSAKDSSSSPKRKRSFEREFRFGIIPESKMRKFREQTFQDKQDPSGGMRKEVGLLHSAVRFSVPHREIVVRDGDKWLWFRSQVTSKISAEYEKYAVNRVSSMVDLEQFLQLQKRIMSLLPLNYQVISPEPVFDLFPHYPGAVPSVPVNVKTGARGEGAIRGRVAGCRAHACRRHARLFWTHGTGRCRRRTGSTALRPSARY